MGLVSWILFGFLVGLVARAVTPGHGRLGCIGTIVVGIFGAFVGGLIGEVVFDEEVDFGWDLGPFALAVAGSVVLLLVLSALRRR